MKGNRPILPLHALADPDAYMTTADVARLLRVHPKHVYRLLRRGLPGHRVGGEWRFLAEEIKRWSGARTQPKSRRADSIEMPVLAPDPSPFLAANGDLALERLLSTLNAEDGPVLGFIRADRGEAFDLLRSGAVLAAGYHGEGIPPAVDGQRLAFIHVAVREVGLAFKRGFRFRNLGQLKRLRLASRPTTAGIRAHFDDEARRQGLDPIALHAKAVLLPSHRDVACAVARGEADVGLVSTAWANHVGLELAPLGKESYGILVRAGLLGDPRIVRLCEVAQSSSFQGQLNAVIGYDTRNTGVISYMANTKDAS